MQIRNLKFPFLRPLSQFIAALALCVAAIGCATRAAHAPSFGTPGDERVRVQVRDALLSATSVYAAHIDVANTQGLVTLSGFVYTAQESEKAAVIAMNVPGVQGVDNEIEIKSPFWPARR